VNKSCCYEDIVYVAGFLPTFTLAGGINLPKIITCIGSDGVERRQLVKVWRAFTHILMSAHTQTRLCTFVICLTARRCRGLAVMTVTCKESVLRQHKPLLRIVLPPGENNRLSTTTVCYVIWISVFDRITTKVWQVGPWARNVVKIRSWDSNVIFDGKDSRIHKKFRIATKLSLGHAVPLHKIVSNSKSVHNFLSCLAARQTDRQTDGRTDGRIERKTSGQTESTSCDGMLM